MAHVTSVLQSICAEFGCNQLFMVDGKKPFIDAGVFIRMCTPDGTGMVKTLKALLAHQRLSFEDETQRNGTLLSMKAFVMMLMNGHRIKDEHQKARHKLMISICDLALEGEWTNLDEYEDISDSYVPQEVQEVEEPQKEESQVQLPVAVAEGTSAVPEEIVLDGNVYHTVAVVNGEIHVVETSNAPPSKSVEVTTEAKVPRRTKSGDVGMLRKDFVDVTARQTTKERNHFCEECGKGFTTSWSVKMHMRQHTGEKPHACDQCEKSFRHKSDLTIHKRHHTGERPYKCDFCEKDFCKSYTLLTHRRTHTGEKPYECPYCDKRFAQRNVQRHHTRLHTGEKPYKCEFCDKAFSQKAQVKQHQRYNDPCMRKMAAATSLAEITGMKVPSGVATVVSVSDCGEITGMDGATAIVHAAEVMAQSDQQIVQVEEMVDSTEIVQSTEEMVESAEIVHSTEEMVQAAEHMVQFTEEIAQSTQATEVVETMTESGDLVEQQVIQD